MRTRFAVTLALGLLMLGSLAAPVMATSTPSTVAVSFDFGNGQIAWTDVTITPGMNMLNATKIGASQLGFSLVEQFGFVSSVNGYAGDFPSNVFWGFFVWNTTNGVWDMASVGPSSIAATNFTAISWHYAFFRMDFTQAPSLATPDHRYPWASQRHDALGTASQDAFAPNNITLKWSMDLGNGAIDSSVVAVGGYEFIVTSGRLNHTTWAIETNSTIVCLNSTGHLQWQHDIGKGYQLAAPLVTNDKVVVSSADGNVSAFNRTDGLPLWTFNTHSGTVFGSPSPIAFREDIIVATATGKVFRLTQDGDEVWNKTAAPSIYSSSPTIKDAIIYIGSENGKLHAINANAGTELWNVTVGGRIRGTPIATDVGIVCTYTNLSSGSAISGGVSLINYTGHILAYAQTGVTPGSAAQAMGGVVSMTPTNMYKVDATGHILWNISLGTSGAFSIGSPVAVKGTIFAVTDEAHSRLVAVSENGVLYSQYALTPANYAVAAPSVADGVLYCAGDNGVVYAFNLNTVAPSPSTDFTASKHNLAATFSTPTVPGKLFDFSWSYGDGTHGSGNYSTHTYAAAGTYNVTLTVSNPSGQKLNVSRSLTVHAFTAPRNFTAVAGQGKITLTWQAPVDNGDSPVTMYLVYRAAPGLMPTEIAELPASARSYVDSNCTVGTNYTYHMTAMNSLDTSPASNTASATAQTTPADNTLLYVGIIVVVIAVIAIAALLVMRGRKK